MLIIPSEIKGLIFDLDGTLADTLPLHYKAWHETFADWGVTCPQAFLDSLSGVPTEQTVVRFNQTFGYEIDPKRFTRAKEERARAALPAAKPIAPLTALARRYKGRLPMAVATGADRTNASVTLQAIGLHDHFGAIVTADDPVAPKPAPDIYLEAARRLAVEPRLCLVFEDADCGLEAARRAGMPTVDVRTLLKPQSRYAAATVR